MWLLKCCIYNFSTPFIYIPQAYFIKNLVFFFCHQNKDIGRNNRIEYIL